MDKKIILVVASLGLFLIAGCEDAFKNCHMETRYKTVNEKNCEYEVEVCN